MRSSDIIYSKTAGVYAVNIDSIGAGLVARYIENQSGFIATANCDTLRAFYPAVDIHSYLFYTVYSAFVNDVCSQRYWRTRGNCRG